MSLQYRENEYYFHDEDEQKMLLRALALSLEKDNNDYRNITSGSMGLGPANPQSEAEREIQECSLKYLENRCNPVTRAPYLENNCTFWEDCMNRNPDNNVKEAELYAKQMARIISVFLENLSYEARMMFFIFLVMIFGYVTFKHHK
ncbi:1739_t:CDS:2 [Funneliformis caledonium]|uniref:1739_t:CDS:1 n=1 Tax=Funneliformis caledonium TaxID=1117310 RepID=A0A9N9ARU4_9GLOM|nr:1739_t:CDS:2 [Funneliformis caledonium]